MDIAYIVIPFLFIIMILTLAGVFDSKPNHITEVVYVDGLNEIDSTAAWVYLDLETSELIIQDLNHFQFEGNIVPNNELILLGVL